MSNESTEKRLKISNPERVTRILRRICQASLQVFIRSTEKTEIAVKGRASTISTESRLSSMRISNISEQGMSYLLGRERVRVEFVMMSTKVVFVSRVIGSTDGSLLIELPTSLVSVERRKNARFPITPDLTAFLNLSQWQTLPDDLAGPPVFPNFAQLGSYLGLVDISQGGLCAVSRFPAPYSSLKRGMIDDKAQLILPMQQPITVAFEIRWCKRTKEHVRDVTGATHFIRSYRFGGEFINPSDDARMLILQFIQQLSQAGAI